MKFSIILPVKNGGKYVKECVNSILSQSLQDFNLIVLDNCSIDGTLEWLQSLEDVRIKIIPSHKPLTIEENWGRIIDVQKNEFITLIGHDDILYPDFLKVVDNLINTYPGAALYHTHFNYIDAKGDKIRSSRPMSLNVTGYEFLKDFLTISVDSMGTGYVMRSNDYDSVGGIPARYPNLLFADFELWLNIALKSFIVTTPETCFAFRKHQSVTGTSEDNKLHKALSVFIDFLFSLQQRDTQAKEIIDRFGVAFLLFYCKGLSHRLLRTPKRKRDNLTVSNFIAQTKKLALKLGIQDQYKPNRVLSIRLAGIIDRVALLRGLFLIFKKMHPKPVLD